MLFSLVDQGVSNTTALQNKNVIHILQTKEVKIHPLLLCIIQQIIMIYLVV